MNPNTECDRKNNGGNIRGVKTPEPAFPKSNPVQLLLARPHCGERRCAMNAKSRNDDKKRNSQISIFRQKPESKKGMLTKTARGIMAKMHRHYGKCRKSSPDVDASQST